MTAYEAACDVLIRALNSEAMGETEEFKELWETYEKDDVLHALRALVRRLRTTQLMLDEYQLLAGRTNAPYTSALHATTTLGFGLAGEAGEVLDLLKKSIGHGHALDHDKLKKELGDVLWYLASLSAHYGLSLNDVAQANIDKLKARYPDGFSTERSQKRDE